MAAVQLAESVFGQVKATLVARSGARSQDVARWFAQNEVLLLQVARAVALRVQEGADREPMQAAAQTLQNVRAQLVTRLPQAAGWFSQYDPLLQRVAQSIALRIQHEAQEGTPPLTESEPNLPPDLRAGEEELTLGESEANLPPDLRTPGERTAANVRALQILGRGAAILPEERLQLRNYTGLGGLSREVHAKHVAEEWLPEARGAIHEYYTPTLVASAIAAAVRPRLASLAREDGTVVALEPSAGIGRLIEACSGPGFESVRFYACEYSRVSGRILQALRPDVDTVIAPFEQWVMDHAHLAGELGLIVANPPYGVRGASEVLDKDRAYREHKAYAYFMRRALDFLRAGGLGVFLVPYGFLTGATPELRSIREAVLKRHHLAAAFRLPSEDGNARSLFPGALLVTDLLFFRARGGELSEVPESDRYILDGGYFNRHPSHILGHEVGQKADEDTQGAKPRWGYQVRGDFTVLPLFEERPPCRDCEIKPFLKKKPAPAPVVEPEPIREALQLAQRASLYLAEVTRGTAESIQRARALHADLKEALLAWHAQPEPEKIPVAAAVRRRPELTTLLSAVDKGQLLASFHAPPEYVPRYAGASQDIAAQAEYLYSLRRQMSFAEVLAAHRSLHGKLSEAQMRADLVGAGFCFDGEYVLPERDYYTGTLWERYERAKWAAEHGDAQAAAQAARLLDAIKPASWADLRPTPRLGWIPVEVLQEFLNTVLLKRAQASHVLLERSIGGLLGVRGVSYGQLEESQAPTTYQFIGYVNHDMSLFRLPVRRSENESLDQKRIEYDRQITERFTDWLEGQPEQQAAILAAYNRLFRGWVTPTYPQDELAIARWNPKYPLYGYQNAGVRRLVANRGGGLFFDVGLGKTRTLLAALALARQQGWARRPAIVVPNSVIWNWLAELQRVLPDFRVVVIGSDRVVLSRGQRKGTEESATDSPAERAAKWQRFRAGLYDVALVTYSVLDRTRMRVETLLPIIRRTPAIQREIGLQVRDMQERLAKPERSRNEETEKEAAQRADREALRRKLSQKPLTEREQAIRAEREENFAAQMSELPDGAKPDSDLTWEDHGIDWLGFDESHTGKNLWTVEEREGGKPRFLGSPQKASRIAWQMFFRSAIVRQHTGGSGVHLADATPAKNSPLEFLSLLSFLDDNIWARLGITDAEQFVSQFLKIEHRMIQDTDLRIVQAPCVVGFRSLDLLREVLYRYGEFRTAKQVGLRIPEPRVERIQVPMDARQNRKYELYLQQYREAISSIGFNPDSRYKALGLLQRMALVAVHAELDSRTWTYATAKEVQDASSPKLDTMARLVAQRKECGHLIFLDNIAAHYWMRERLLAVGLAAERIAVLNGEVSPTPLARQKIAEGFTSDQPLYDVVIANRVAYEGLNLQGRTCAIYHGDLPYEPATLQQRNGRGQRQGNKYDVISIYYVLSDRSMDMARFQLIYGKREWMAAVVDSAASETNNPAAQAELSPEDWLMFLSRDKEETARMIAERKAKLRQDEDNRIRREAWNLVRAIVTRQREAQRADLMQRTRLFEEITRLIDQLEAMDAQVWPWRFVGPKVAQTPALTFGTNKPGVIWEGARLAEKSFDGRIVGGYEFGRIALGTEAGIGARMHGSLSWDLMTLEHAARLWERTTPAHWQADWPSYEDELREMVKTHLRLIAERGLRSFRSLDLRYASEPFMNTLWAMAGLQFVQALAAARDQDEAALPWVTDSGLQMGGGRQSLESGRVLPWTAEGYAEFLRMAPASKLSFGDLDEIAQWWWGRHIPRGLLAQRVEATRSAA